MAYLNAALTTFRNEVNRKFPNRDKTSDGWIGDAAHQATTSDHNPDSDGSVDAWDMDVDLFSFSNDAAEIERLKNAFQRHESSRYWIHNRRIASRSDGWIRRYYDGPNPHDKHVHWNTRTEFENSTKPFLEEDDMLTAQEKNDWQHLIWRMEALIYALPTIRGGPEKGKAVPFVQRVNELTEDVDALNARPTVEVDYDKLADAIVRRVFTPTV